ncbi:fumarylacetoacetate hydrolase family protein [Pseudocolwellia sp. HL-MZ19]|uniref:fumarylacetoacetate hydrolase family protein n=1 Tax=unclassified Pseudocolwellia TaxID=2848178 RepID=UPI003CF19A6E
MKLATLKNDTRDGQLVVVSRDLSQCITVPNIASSLQQALDDWSTTEPLLNAVYLDLNNGSLESLPFNQSDCTAPLPRAYHWADGSAYVNHVELVRKARNAVLPESFWTEPLIYQGGSDVFLAPHDDIPLEDESWGMDLEGEVAVITDDVKMGTKPEDAADKIKLIMLVNDVTLRNEVPAELAKGFGFYQAKPFGTFSPIAVTPDELGDAWHGGKLHLPLLVTINGELFGKANAGVDMTFDFSTIISHAAKTRPLGAGTIVGSGTVSNKQNGGPGKPVPEGGLGYSCLGEIRMIETIQHGKPSTPFLRFGDHVRIEMNDAKDCSIFGTIEQTVVKFDK